MSLIKNFVKSHQSSIQKELVHYWSNNKSEAPLVKIYEDKDKVSLQIQPLYLYTLETKMLENNKDFLLLCSTLNTYIDKTKDNYDFDSNVFNSLLEAAFKENYNIQKYNVHCDFVHSDTDYKSKMFDTGKVDIFNQTSINRAINKIEKYIREAKVNDKLKNFEKLKSSFLIFK